MEKIMLVDDAAFMRMMIKNALTQKGYSNFVEAQDGAEAVKKYDEEKPDLVIMDITMPNIRYLRQDCHVHGHGPGEHGCGRH